MSSMSYEAPTSLSQAVRILHDSTGARVLAGGTDLLVQMKLGIRRPATVVDVKHIPELMEMTLSDRGLHLGAAVPGAVVTASDAIRRVFPGFVEALGLIGSSQVQGRCSAGGNLCNASPAADCVCALIVNGAVCQVLGSRGPRSIPVEQFTIGPGKNSLAADELLVSLELPLPAPRTSDAYLRFIPRTEMDIAVAGAAVSLTLDEAGTCTAARVAIGSVAPTALLVPAAAAALIGSTVDATALEEAGAAASAAASPITDKRGTAEYRRKIVAVLVRRAAALAKTRIEAAV